MVFFYDKSVSTPFAIEAIAPPANAPVKAPASY